MPKYDAFLSHNSIDKPAVEELARRLVKEGIQPWLDTWNLIPGEPWQEAIEDALDKCATCAVFIGPSGTGPWQNEEMRAAIQRRVEERRGSERPFRVIPVLLPGAERVERSRLPSFLVATTWVEFRQTLDDEQVFHRLLSGIRGVKPGPGPGQAIYEGQNPYRGLQVFDVEHAPFFFGREALTEWLLDELRPSPQTELGQENRFLAIIGPSGSGKSSLARAGLIAALEQGKIEGSANWLIAILRPGSDPLESLAVALCAIPNLGLTALNIPELVEKLKNDDRSLHQIIRVALHNAPSERRLVLLVDQFEEVFTLCHNEPLRQALIDNLLHAASVVGGQTIIVLTMRADFYGKCAAHSDLAAAMSDHQVLVGPMTNDELRRAIERPAQLAGGEFEAGLVEALLHDVQDQPGGLPLLQHALLELWRQRKGRRLTYDAYNTIGRIEGALERRAETVYENFAEAEREICQRIFLRLTQPGEGTEDTKRRVSFQELMPVEKKYESVEAVIQTLADARLITTQGGEELEGERFVEIAHEALIRGWARLRAWIEKDREALRIHRKLTEAAQEWSNRHRDTSYLYVGIRLVQAQELPKEYELNQLEREFLSASEVQQQQVEFREELGQKFAFLPITNRNTLSRQIQPILEDVRHFCGSKYLALFISPQRYISFEDNPNLLPPFVFTGIDDQVRFGILHFNWRKAGLITGEKYNEDEDEEPSDSKTTYSVKILTQQVKVQQALKSGLKGKEADFFCDAVIFSQLSFSAAYRVVLIWGPFSHPTTSDLEREETSNFLQKISEEIMRNVLSILQNLDTDERTKAWSDVADLLTHYSRRAMDPILTGVRIVSDYLRDGGIYSKKDVLSAVESLEAASRFISQVVHAPLYSFVAMAEEIYTFAPTSLETIVQDCVSLYHPIALEKGITIQVGPSVAELPQVEVDELKLRDAVGYVLDNALKYSHENKEVRIYGESLENHVRLTIEDFGQGIKDEELELVFERGYQGHRSRKAIYEVGEEGMGLFHARLIVEAHKGKIWCGCRSGPRSETSAKLEGYRVWFTFELPTKQSDD